MGKEEEVSSHASFTARDYPAIPYLDAEGKLSHSKGNGDAIHVAMINADVGDLKKVAKAYGFDWDKSSNFGLARASLGNALRARVKGGEAVTVNGITVKKLDQKVINPAVKAGEDHIKQKAKDSEKAAKEASKAAAKAPAKKASAPPKTAPKTAPKALAKRARKAKEDTSAAVAA